MFIEKWMFLMFFKILFSTLFLSLFTFALPLIAMEEEQERRIVLRAPNSRVEFAFTREPLEAQLAKNLALLFKKDFKGNLEEFTTFLGSGDFLDAMWYNDEVRQAYLNLAALHPLRQSYIQRQGEHSFTFRDLRPYFKGKGKKKEEIESTILSILHEIASQIEMLTCQRTNTFSKLPESLQERILERATRIEDSLSIEQELAMNLAFLYRHEFKSRIKHLESFLRSRKFINLLKQEALYFNTYNTIAIQHSVLFDSCTNLLALSSQDERPLFLLLDSEFGEDLPRLQGVLTRSISKSLGLTKEQSSLH